MYTRKVIMDINELLGFKMNPKRDTTSLAIPIENTNSSLEEALVLLLALKTKFKYVTAIADETTGEFAIKKLRVAGQLKKKRSLGEIIEKTKAKKPQSIKDLIGKIERKK